LFGQDDGNATLADGEIALPVGIVEVGLGEAVANCKAYLIIL
jgi:hypothetical protein